nr:histone deacetylase 14 [Tanacetum cinerariifolium]
MLFPTVDSRRLSSVIWEEFTIFIKDQHLRFILVKKTSDLECTILQRLSGNGRKAPFHLSEEDFRLGNLKFVPKGKIDEVFGMLIPDELILNNIRNAPYYNAYLEMVAKHDRKVAAKKEGKKKNVSAKQPKSKPAIE